jgi:hypothetical protein
MLQAHSLLWNYLWVAPNLLLLTLGFFLYKRGLHKQLPAFFVFAILSSLGDMAVFAADVIPSVTAPTFWSIDWLSLLLESFLKFLVIGEVFSRLFNPYAAVSKLGRVLVSGFGGALVLFAAVTAAYARGDSPVRYIAGFHLLEQTVFIVESGLIVFLFLFAAYFRLSWDRFSFGVLLGLGISSSGYLAAWAIMTNADPSNHGRTLLDFLNMAIYHVCVLIWFYYLLLSRKVAAKPVVPLPEHNLEVWNRELERLLQQ